jgi:hypothetical protein
LGNGTSRLHLLQRSASGFEAHWRVILSTWWNSSRRRVPSCTVLLLPALGDDRLNSMPSAIEDMRFALLDAFDRQHQIDAAANLVAAISRWAIRRS